ncbi:hypothetical protein HU200_025139 [Digitaria exilis]|uniref:FAF domain-containing protein n=1 Tax=Digitaria exilis TaxID=1010633 RepID=A0A835EVQ4_9POAL|nr:hypothetical protein HU200_025139 [Digitaria exilis]
MALTVFETSEQQQQLLPCQQQGADAGKAAAAAGGGAAMLKETDHGGDNHRPERAAIWNMIQAQQKPPAPTTPKQAYVHPLVRRSSSLLTQKSLEICTESLGSETGSDGFSDADGSSTDRSSSDDDEREEEEAVAPRVCPPRAFPPPLPSLARRKVESTMEMRQERQDGRLLVRVVPVASSTLFRAQRRGGRLLLSFADTPAPASDELDKTQGQLEPEQNADDHDHDASHEVEDEEDEDDEEEVEVVDRGTVVEVKVSTPPQARSKGSGPRVRRSSLVINKFVGAEPAATCEINGSTTTAVAALAAASVLSATAPPPGNGEEAVPGATCGENKLLMTAKRRSSKEELLNNMRRCNQLHGNLFFWEPRIATSS